MNTRALGHLPAARRFEALRTVDARGCWILALRPSSNGYVSIQIDGARWLAHRWSYEHHVGPIAPGLTIDHLCRNRACVNPSHLEPVTLRVNLLRSNAVSGVNAARSSCVNGHEFTPENTYVRPDGRGRQCKACGRERSLADWRRRTAS